MRVAIVVPEYLPHPGGIQRHVEELAAGLDRRGVAVDILAAEVDRSLPAVSTSGSVTIRRFPVGPRVPRYTVSAPLVRYLRSSGSEYDVLHAHNYHELVPWYAALSRHRSLVLTSHYHAPSPGRAAALLRAPHRVLMRRVVSRVRTVICVTHAEMAALQVEIPAATARMVVIPNGVDSERIRQAAPTVLDRPFVLSVGRLEGYKRVDLLVRAMSAMAACELVVAGDGPERAALTELAESVGTPSRFLGRISDDELHGWIRGAAAVVTMSEREAFGLVILEAFAAGVPVVASDIPAHRETASYGPPGAAQLAAPGLAPGKLTAMIDRAVRSGPRGFDAAVPTWDDMAERTLAVYRAAGAR